MDADSIFYFHKNIESRFYKESIPSFLFVDDSYLQGAIKELYLQNVEAMVKTQPLHQWKLIQQRSNMY